MAVRRRRLRHGVVKLSDLVEVEWILAGPSPRETCLRCGHYRMQHHRMYRQCRLAPCECHWFRYKPSTGVRFEAPGEPSANLAVDDQTD